MGRVGRRGALGAVDKGRKGRGWMRAYFRSSRRRIPSIVAMSCHCRRGGS